MKILYIDLELLKGQESKRLSDIAFFKKSKIFKQTKKTTLYTQTYFIYTSFENHSNWQKSYFTHQEVPVL